MNKTLVGRILLTVVLAATTILSFILDWSPNHLLNPLWHPHARFHGALLLFMLAGVSGTAIWLLWRKSSEPNVALRAAALVSLSFWTPLFYITSLLSGSTSWAGAPGADPRLRGSLVTPNLIVAALFILITIASFYLSFNSENTAKNGSVRRPPSAPDINVVPG
jgi:ABC-type transport system involved in multi-copper enzyme maturation permease subunit